MTIKSHFLPILFLLTLLASFDASPQELFLENTNCQTLEEHANAIITWSERLTPDANSKLPSCHCQSNKCQIEISDIVPSFVSNRDLRYGPNCWNSSLVGAGILSYFTYATPEEMTFWMHSPLCRLKNSDEALNPGDVIAIRSITEENVEGFGPPGIWNDYVPEVNYQIKEIHGITYLAPDLVFTKNGPTTNNKHQFASLKAIYAHYKVRNANCQQLESENIDDIIKAGCISSRYSNIYECWPLSSYLDSINITQIDQELFEKLNQLDKTVTQALFTKGRIPSNLQQKWHEQAKEIRDSANQDNFIGKIIATHAQSLFRQTDEINLNFGY